MSESREASWYEIALTHSQIVKIFVVLLLCLVAAFFSGVWIGRDGGETAREASPQVASDELAAAVENGEVGQLNFFRDGEDGSATAGDGTSEESASDGGARETPRRRDADEPQKPAIDTVRSGTTLVDDLEGREREAVAERRSPPEDLIVRAGEAVSRRNEPEAPVPVTREVEPQVASTGTAVASGPAAGAEGDLVVQVFSSNDANQARKVLGQLTSGGHPAFLSPVEVEGRTMYRVRIGPYTERGDAERVADTVKRAYKLDTWITSKST